MCILSLLGKGSVECIPPFIARQRPSNQVPAAKNTLKSRRIARRVFLWICLCIPLSLLGSNSVKTFPRQRKIAGGVIFYSINVVLRESRRLVLPRTSCLIFNLCKLGNFRVIWQWLCYELNIGDLIRTLAFNFLVFAYFSSFNNVVSVTQSVHLRMI
jgi:hypothetical protein